MEPLPSLYSQLGGVGCVEECQQTDLSFKISSWVPLILVLLGVLVMTSVNEKFREMAHEVGIVFYRCQ